MKARAPRTPILLSILLTLLVGFEATAQRPQGGGAWGDWLVTVEYDGREMESILAFSRDSEGARTGQWISFWGANDLSELTLDGGDLSFTWSIQGWEGQTMTSRFAGRIEEGTLTGTLSGDRGEFAVNGARLPRPPRAVGNWDLAFRVRDMDVTSTLKITAHEDRTLAGEWISEWGEHQITEIASERGQLTFNRVTTFEDREFASSFTGTLSRSNTLAGTLSSEMGEIEVTGVRQGAAAIGTWMLDIDSERGARKQRLRIDRDLSARMGSIAVAAVAVDGQKISFPMNLDFGDQAFEMSFQGTVDGNRLTGEMTSERGTRNVTGERVVRSRGPRGPQ